MRQNYTMSGSLVEKQRFNFPTYKFESWCSNFNIFYYYFGWSQYHVIQYFIIKKILKVKYIIKIIFNFFKLPRSCIHCYLSTKFQNQDKVEIWRWRKRLSMEKRPHLPSNKKSSIYKIINFFVYYFIFLFFFWNWLWVVLF